VLLGPADEPLRARRVRVENGVLEYENGA